MSTGSRPQPPLPPPATTDEDPERIFEEHGWTIRVSAHSSGFSISAYKAEAEVQAEIWVDNGDSVQKGLDRMRKQIGEHDTGLKKNGKALEGLK